MSQCDTCVCKSCTRLLFCRGLLGSCQDCYSSGFNAWLECELKIKVEDMLSTFQAKVTVNREEDTIENHIKNAVKHKAGFFMIDDMFYEIRYLPQFKKMLWLKYFRSNPHVVEFIKKVKLHLEDLHLSYIQNQLDIALEFIDSGDQSVLKQCQELIKLINNSRKVS